MVWTNRRLSLPQGSGLDWQVTLPSARTYTEWEVTLPSASKWTGLYRWLCLLQELIQSERWLSLLRLSGLDCTGDSPFCKDWYGVRGVDWTVQVTLPSARTDTEWEVTLPSAIKWSGLYRWLSLLQGLIRSERCGLDCTCDSAFCKNWYRVRGDSPFCD